MFSNSDDILRNVFNPESKDGIDASNLLKRVYKGKFNDHMQAFLRRDLREDILRDWDQNDPELLEKGEKQENKETQILPVVDYASASGDDQPKYKEQVSQQEIPPPSVFVRVEGMKNLERIMVSLECYKPAKDTTSEDDDDDVRAMSDSESATSS